MHYLTSKLFSKTVAGVKQWDPHIEFASTTQGPHRFI